MFTILGSSDLLLLLDVALLSRSHNHDTSMTTIDQSHSRPELGLWLPKIYWKYRN